MSYGSSPYMEDVVLPTQTELIGSLLTKYRNDLAEATGATENALKQLKQQLQTMERNQIAIAAQKALIDTLERDLARTQDAKTTTSPA